ncbi:class I SAM-dependent methyltransferase [Streptomyces ipomoeae]|uniref:Cyclopropane-fatty-acyl-phospholipid synthase n=2 Tax=Streptomyces ipomoeae TaxID=103232 RepID=L1KND7_9ACTN|nr:cyclopropane-fatty-acyl-phospholipid synthase family protein [Streptomyces ipomoeae]EKX62079.1 cyclopropane-fatty-acyl-phospholipid synthase [Streptomyces ipomoeae 91-03]MDX2692652.1 cyclopropane-fatty-acyl-phospholipid synthase [Streptomyces ipomoeae]MDX2838744.1 cyclopropane-fatty-acyl-phospholipid synthase [Streptomyces ipomoeae]TQE35749.1 class I SAM-dependent methyltransferase [Streptomyces ipomoeae]TQE38999.1 class I SAM-dependent methyltransferase [Streptomyces ipomoeae]
MTTIDYLGATAQAIRHHYDVSNDFFALWLDEDLTYTCALWDFDDPGDTLEAAQKRKLDHLIEGARASGAGRVLDVGCGWGSLLDRLVNVHDVGQAVGLTLSDSQAERLREAALPRTEVRVENWLDHEPAEGYDAIISIGAFEHFARTGLSRAERVAAYREFFERCRAWLPKGGRLALQTNVKGNNVRMDRQTVRDLMFIIDIIFPESEIPALSEVVESSEKRFDIVALRNDPDHYSRTCQEWLNRLRAHRDQAVKVAGEENVANYERYLGATVGHFANRHLGLSRLILEAV